MSARVMESDEEGGAEDGRMMGVVIGCYLLCMGCCTVCCTTLVLMLLVFGALCFSHGDGTDCGSAGYPGGGVIMLMVGSIPPVSAVMLLLYMQGDKRGWWRPDYVAPGIPPPPPNTHTRHARPHTHS